MDLSNVTYELQLVPQSDSNFFSSPSGMSVAIVDLCPKDSLNFPKCYIYLTCFLRDELLLLTTKYEQSRNYVGLWVLQGAQNMFQNLSKLLLS